VGTGLPPLLLSLSLSLSLAVSLGRRRWCLFFQVLSPECWLWAVGVLWTVLLLESNKHL
jgi:hypothetical protein